MKIIAGPCQHESLEQSLDIANYCIDSIRKVADEEAIFCPEYYFKASYDKANRTHIDSPRGRGLIQTLLDFQKMKHAIPGLKIVTDFHSVEDIDFFVNDTTLGIQDAVDVIQIPALLSRQTDLIQEAVRSGKTVNVKKGQFMAPWDIEGVMSKTKGAKEVWITERGTSFGYNRLVVDFLGLNAMHNLYPNVIFDGTHSVQTPSSNGRTSGGNRDDVLGLFRAAAGLGIENFFMEVHPDPDNAPSDGPNSLDMFRQFEMAIRQIVQINFVVKQMEGVLIENSDFDTDSSWKHEIPW